MEEGEEMEEEEAVKLFEFMGLNKILPRSLALS